MTDQLAEALNTARRWLEPSLVALSDDRTTEIARALLAVHRRLELAEKVLFVLDDFPILHNDDCLVEEDDHAPDFACTCGVYRLNHGLKEWRAAKGET